MKTSTTNSANVSAETSHEASPGTALENSRAPEALLTPQALLPPAPLLTPPTPLPTAQATMTASEAPYPPTKLPPR